MARPLTTEELLEATQRRVVLPALSQQLGDEVTVLVRRIARSEYLALLPAPPPGSESWDPADWEAKERAWVATLPPEALDARRAALGDIAYRVVARALLDPPMSADQIRRIGDDAAIVMTAVLRFSGLLPEPTAETPPAPEES
jgi:hypothetical protein